MNEKDNEGLVSLGNNETLLALAGAIAEAEKKRHEVGSEKQKKSDVKKPAVSADAETKKTVIEKPSDLCHGVMEFTIDTEAWIKVARKSLFTAFTDVRLREVEQMLENIRSHVASLSPEERKKYEKEIKTLSSLLEVKMKLIKPEEKPEKKIVEKKRTSRKVEPKPEEKEGDKKPDDGKDDHSEDENEEEEEVEEEVEEEEEIERSGLTISYKTLIISAVSLVFLLILVVLYFTFKKDMLDTDYVDPAATESTAPAGGQSPKQAPSSPSAPEVAPLQSGGLTHTNWVLDVFKKGEMIVVKIPPNYDVDVNTYTSEPLDQSGKKCHFYFTGARLEGAPKNLLELRHEPQSDGTIKYRAINRSNLETTLLIGVNYIHSH